MICRNPRIASSRVGRVGGHIQIRPSGNRVVGARDDHPSKLDGIVVIMAAFDPAGDREPIRNDAVVGINVHKSICRIFGEKDATPDVCVENRRTIRACHHDTRVPVCAVVPVSIRGIHVFCNIVPSAPYGDDKVSFHPPERTCRTA